VKGRITKKVKILSGIAAGVMLAAAGFMGVNQFVPQERSLTIIDNAAVTTSKEIAEEAADKAADKAGGALDIKAKAAVLIDGSSGKVLYAQNEKKHLPPASVTKVMTLLLVMEACESGKISLDDQVTVSERAAGMGGSQMYMEEGEQHTVQELLKGVIMVSANDGCVALAEFVSGSVEDFVAAMNERAKELGLEDSHFVNTNGLPVADHYSCAYDIGMISMELMKFEFAREWFTAWQEDIQVGKEGKKSKFTLTNTNKLIRSYNGAIGVKTGFTDDAGYCLSGAAERNGTRLIAVVLGCESSDIRFKETTRLLDYGFANYETIKLAEKNQRLKKIRIEKGDNLQLFAVSAEDVGMTVKKGGADSVETELCIKKDLGLPIKKGDVVGTMEVYEGKNKVAEHELVADRDVQKADFVTTYIRMMKKLI